MITAKNSVLDYIIPGRITTRGDYHPSTEERFWIYAQGNDSSVCWIWRGAYEKKGYGRFNAEGKKLKAHRCAWEFTYGRIPEGMLVCHKCDNRACCNPNHLFLGTDSDNMKDMVNKGRNVNPLAGLFGDRNPRAKISEKDVREIRELYKTGNYSYEKLSSIYGVSFQYIGDIVNYKKRTRELQSDLFHKVLEMVGHN